MDIIQGYLETVSWEIIILSCVRILIILVALLMAIKFANFWLQRLERYMVIRGKAEGVVPSEATKRAETLIRLMRQAIMITLWVMTILVILKEIGMDIAPILASAGVVGIAIGFGAQNLVRDVISGFFIILENQVRVGDVAIVNGTGGLVEAVNFRTMVLRDESGVVHVFPNGTITTLSNMTKEWSAYVINIAISYKEDPDKTMEIMRRVGKEMRSDKLYGRNIIDDIEIFGVDAFGDSAMVIKARLKTLPIKQWDVGREYLRRLKLAFDEAGIEIPFPHRTLYFDDASKPLVAKLLNQGKADGSSGVKSASGNV